MDNLADKPEHEKKITLTIATLSGDYTHDFKLDTILQEVVDKTVQKLKLVNEGSWVLEYNGKILSLDETIEHADLKDGDILTLSPQEGGGGSRSK